jgi:hypothetical protein
MWSLRAPSCSAPGQGLLDTEHRFWGLPKEAGVQRLAANCPDSKLLEGSVPSAIEGKNRDYVQVWPVGMGRYFWDSPERLALLQVPRAALTGSPKADSLTGCGMQPCPASSCAGDRPRGLSFFWGTYGAWSIKKALSARTWVHPGKCWWWWVWPCQPGLTLQNK